MAANDHDMTLAAQMRRQAEEAQAAQRVARNAEQATQVYQSILEHVAKTAANGETLLAIRFSTAHRIGDPEAEHRVMALVERARLDGFHVDIGARSEDPDEYEITVQW